MRRLIEEHNPDAILLGEVDVEVEAYQDYFGNNDRLNLVLNFWLNKYFYVSLARKSARPLRNAVKKMIVPPDSCCFANWLRNHDELDLEGISQKDKQFVLDTFAPEEMNVYQRGIRRRLAPMLNGDLKRLAFCHAVLFSLPGVPVMRYGDEIGMGDDLDLEERYAVRTPMQWAGSQGGGFSAADPEKFIAPIIDRGPYRYQKINVADSLLHRNSLLHRIIDIANTRSEFPEIAVAPFRLLTIDSDAVLGIYYETEERSILTFVNFSDQPVQFTVKGSATRPGPPVSRTNATMTRWFAVKPSSSALAATAIAGSGRTAARCADYGFRRVIKRVNTIPATARAPNATLPGIPEVTDDARVFASSVKRPWILCRSLTGWSR
jgi:maltose alpha-D-glucosyltransferase/alpha-amylase